MRRLLSLIVLLGAMALTGSAQSPSARNVVHGHVVSAENGAPLHHARVQVTTATETSAPVLTDADGGFAISTTTATTGGPLRLFVSKPGYLRASLASPRADDDLAVRLQKAAAISGRITDPLGDSAGGMVVSVEITVASSPNRQVVATAQTDDRGDYRVSGLAAGSYFLRIDTVDPQSARLRRLENTRIYYPGPQTVAQPIPVSAGEERFSIDFPVPTLPPLDPQGTQPRQATPFDRPGANGVRGRVIDVDGRPLPRSTVRLEWLDAEGRGRPPMLTDDEGRYEFQNVPAGSYTVFAGRPGFIEAPYGQRQFGDTGEPIDIKAGESRNNLDITLLRYGTISGQVVDDAGEPVEGANMHVLHVRYADGRRRLVELNARLSLRTDDRGRYRLYGLSPDQYIVSVSVGQLVRKRSAIGADVLEPTPDLPGYAMSYFPGTINPAEARPIAIGGGQDFSSIDLALLRAPTARITGTAVDSTGRPLPDGLILAPSQRSSALATNPVGAEIDADGHFEFANVAPGEYVIQANQRIGDPFDEGESASQLVTVGTADVTGLVVRLTRGSTVKGRIVVDGSPAIDSAFSMDLQALPVDLDQTPRNLDGAASARIRPDGTFDMIGLLGPRVLRLVGGPPGWMLKAVLVGGRDITDSPLALGAPQTIGGVEVVLTDRVTEVKGQALDARGQSVKDAAAIVFASDRRSWAEPSRFIAAAATARNGLFTIRNLPPGDYYAAAIAGIQPAEARDPDLLNALIPGAVRFSIADGGSVTISVRVSRLAR